MATKAHSTVVTAEQVKVALRKAATAFAQEDENFLRMRHGQGVDPSAPLPRAAGSNAALADELLFMEVALMRQFGPRAETAKATPTKSAAKDKMARVLKAKKK